MLMDHTEWKVTSKSSMEGLKQHFAKLSNSLAESLAIESEIASLRAIRDRLTVETQPSVTKSLDLEQDFLTLAADSLGSEYTDPFPSFKLDSVLHGQEELNDFMLYVLERRYGWSEVENGKVTKEDEDFRNKAIDHERVGRLKTHLNELLESFIHWFLCQNISVPILCSFRNAISKASNRPVVRNQTVVIMMDWLHQNSSQPGFHSHWRQVQELLVCGVTDIWSAIRNACINRLGPIVDCFTLVKLEAFYCTLVKICRDPHSSWQAKEGAIMAVIVILRNFHWVGRLSHSFSEHSVNETSFYLKYGHEEMQQLPRFLADSLHSLIYLLLAHPQISVRDNATKAFSSFLSRCEFQEALNALDEAISRLSPSREPYQEGQGDDDGALRMQDPSVDEELFVDAYEAEGLISVCTGLIKQIPASFLLNKWTFYFSVFNNCLMHPASTVRQVTSTLLKYLVAKSSQAPLVLKLTLQSLVTNWCVNVEQILAMHQGVKQPIIRIHQGKATRDAGMASDDSATEEHSDQTLLATWEWREGRLLTYELIAKFLVHNHVHYIFPSHAIQPARFRGTASVDAVMQSRTVVMLACPEGLILEVVTDYMSTFNTKLGIGRYLKSSSGEKLTLSKSVGYSGGQSSRQAWGSQRGQSEEDSSGSVTPNDSPRHQISPTPNSSELSRSGSYRKKSLEQKRSRTMAEGNFYGQPTPNQYSYPEDSKKSPLQSPRKGSSFLIAPSSLLHLIKDSQSIEPENDCDVSKSRYIPFPKRLTDKSHHQLEKEEKNLVIDQKAETQDEDDNWELVSVSTLFSQMLLQTIECLGSDQWELRRMGHQTLPILTEAIRYFDVTLLTALIDAYFSPKVTVMTYGLSLAVKSTLQHALRLENFTDSSGPNSMDSTKTCSILDTVEQRVSRWVLIARDLVNRPCVDKLSFVAVEILFLACTNFSQYLSVLCVRCAETLSLTINYQDETKTVVDTTCVKFSLDLFSHAHPSHRYSKYLFKTKKVRMDIDTPAQGYLSILKGDGLHRLSLQMQHYLVSECYSLFPSFVSNTSVCEVASMLPTLLHLIIVFMEDHDVLKTLLEGCQCLVSKVEQTECSHFPDDFFTALEYSLLGIIDIIHIKATEVLTIRPVLEFYICLGQLVSSTHHLTALFKVIHSRLQDAGSSKTTLDVCNSDLVFRSNDIPASPVDNQPIAAETEDDYEENGSSHPLTTSLNASGGNGQITGVGLNRRRMSSSVGLPTDESDSDSDWDSWEEEEEDQSMLEELFGDFLRTLQGHYRQTAIPGEQSAFEVRLGMVGVLSKRTISRLLHLDL